ncbi:MAG: hypothetical protein L0027_08130, partial [Candidatus Rokubacteria bacterium]|nr:hypothetical protein [Candidatus Rokubacteria bacterium]
MRPRLSRRILGGLVWASAVVCCLVVLPGLLARAERRQQGNQAAVLDQVEARIDRSLRLPEPQARPEGRSPF